MKGISKNDPLAKAAHLAQKVVRQDQIIDHAIAIIIASHPYTKKGGKLKWPTK